jgi:hypothetical protein
VHCVSIRLSAFLSCRFSVYHYSLRVFTVPGSPGSHETCKLRCGSYRQTAKCVLTQPMHLLPSNTRQGRCPEVHKEAQGHSRARVVERGVPVSTYQRCMSRMRQPHAPAAPDRGRARLPGMRAALSPSPAHASPALEPAAPRARASHAHERVEHLLRHVHGAHAAHALLALLLALQQLALAAHVAAVAFGQHILAERLARPTRCLRYELMDFGCPGILRRAPHTHRPRRMQTCSASLSAQRPRGHAMQKVVGCRVRLIVGIIRAGAP